MKTFSNFSIDEILTESAAYNYSNNNEKTIYVKNNLSRLYKWATIKKMPKQLFFKNVENYAKLAVLKKKGLISNNNSIQMMKNVDSYFGNNNNNNNNNNNLRKIAYDSMKYISPTSKLFLKLFGMHINNAAKILVVQNSRMNKTKYFEINTINLEKNIYLTSVKINTVIGLISPLVVAKWNWGHYDWVIKNSVDKVLNVKVEFDEHYGGWIYNVKYIKNQKKLIDIFPKKIKVFFNEKGNKIIEKNKQEILKKQKLIDKKARAELNKAKYYFNVLKLADEETANHTRKVGFLTVLFGQLLGLPPERGKNLAWSAICHDIGKKYIPLEILNKPGTLNDDERNLMNTHGLLSSYHLLQKSKIGEIISMGVIRVGFEHHEKYDGSGNGFGFIGDEISLYGQVIGIVDIFDALIEDRPYRKALSYFKIKEILNELIFKKQISTLLGNFFISEMMPILEKIGYRHNNIDFEENQTDHSEIVRDLIGFLKGHNNKFKVKIPMDLRLFLEKNNSGKYLKHDELENNIISRISTYVNAVEDNFLKEKYLCKIPVDLRNALSLDLPIFLNDEIQKEGLKNE